MRRALPSFVPRALPGFVGALLLAGLVAGCATPVVRQVAEQGKGAVIVRYVIESDTEDSFLRHNVDRSYDMALTISPRVRRADGAPSILASTLVDADSAQGGRVKSVWQAYSLEPGAYVVARIHEAQATGIAVWQRAHKTTWFITPTRLKQDGARIVVMTDETPRFDVRAGTVTYIGTFGARIRTDGGQFVLAPFVEEAVKFYTVDPEAARRIVDGSAFAGLPLESVDVFAGRPDALDVFARPWSSDEDENLALPVGETAALPR